MHSPENILNNPDVQFTVTVEPVTAAETDELGKGHLLSSALILLMCRHGSVSQ